MYITVFYDMVRKRYKKRAIRWVWDLERLCRRSVADKYGTLSDTGEA